MFASSSTTSIEAVRGLSGSVDIAPPLPALRPEDIPMLARQGLAEAHMNSPVPRYMENADCRQVISRLLAGRGFGNR